MRFFSNDARESADDEGAADRPERVQSEPVAVPGQRPPSPWSDAPADDTHDRVEQDTRDRVEQVEEDRADRADETAVVPRHADGDDDPDRTRFHEPAPQPTAFGASTVGGAVAASAMANPADDKWKATDRDSDAASGAADDDSVAPGDGVVESPSEANTTTYASSNATDDDVVDVPLDDDGTFEDPKVPDATPEVTDAAPEVAAADTTPEVAAVAAPAATPAAKPPAEPDAFFAADDAKALQERWRDVQLRFVDSPKEATTEAAALVDEAVEKLTAGLRSRKDGLGGDSDDTETLRVQLRGYRDILNRILGL
ncbi:hypothetical protein [Pseudosporangium ferrugineum]|uniref:Uncharacterized protein n=1 Tax=Pseudosporangium ferrugineum TaxID=439699 RepID=A0A2T0RIP8_9ACTN|nr:hypothetical protein [Pseudosporangium ferrugineum]PRY21063.1 hypothetical protein CLV70_12165 [Pseudosporangium ferrugineum]